MERDRQVRQVDTDIKDRQSETDIKKETKKQRDRDRKGVFLVTDDLVLNGPLGRSLRLFARAAHSAHSLCSAPLRYARSVHGLAHSLRSLPCGTVEILEYVFTLLSRFTGTNAFFIFTRNTPYVANMLLKLNYCKRG